MAAAAANIARDHLIHVELLTGQTGVTTTATSCGRFIG